MVFDCVNSSSPDVIIVATDVIRNMLDFMSPETVLEKYSRCLLRFYGHPNVLVRAVVPNFLKGCKKWDNAAVSTLESNKE